MMIKLKKFLLLHRKKRNKSIIANGNPDTVLFPFYRQEYWVIERLSNLFIFTQFVVVDSIFKPMSNFPKFLFLFTTLPVLFPFLEMRNLSLERLTDSRKITPLTYCRGRIRSQIFCTTVLFSVTMVFPCCLFFFSCLRYFIHPEKIIVMESMQLIFPIREEVALFNITMKWKLVFPPKSPIFTYNFILPVSKQIWQLPTNNTTAMVII